jgi:hypothetical protein
MAGWVPMPPMQSVRSRHAMIAVGSNHSRFSTKESTGVHTTEGLQDWLPQLVTGADSRSRVHQNAAPGAKNVSRYPSQDLNATGGGGHTAELVEQEPELAAEAVERHARSTIGEQHETNRAMIQQLQQEVLQHRGRGSGSGRGRGRGRGRDRGRGRSRWIRNDAGQEGRWLHVAGVDDLVVAAAAAGL